MKRLVVGILMATASLVTYAADTAAVPTCQNGQVLISSVGHAICASVTTNKDQSLEISMPAGAGSDLDKMHVGFGDKIYKEYQDNMKHQAIPAPVDKLIRVVTYNGATYQCASATVDKKEMLVMSNCKKETAPTATAH